MASNRESPGDDLLSWAISFATVETTSYSLFSEAAGDAGRMLRRSRRFRSDLYEAECHRFNPISVGDAVIQLSEHVSYGVNLPPNHPDVSHARPTLVTPRLRVYPDERVFGSNPSVDLRRPGLFLDRSGQPIMVDGIDLLGANTTAMEEAQWLYVHYLSLALEHSQ